jgi:hypothetical protein
MTVIISGDDWTVHLDHLAKLKPFATDPNFQRHFMQVTTDSGQFLSRCLSLQENSRLAEVGA